MPRHRSRKRIDNDTSRNTRVVYSTFRLLTHHQINTYIVHLYENANLIDLLRTYYITTDFLPFAIGQINMFHGNNWDCSVCKRKNNRHHPQGPCAPKTQTISALAGIVRPQNFWQTKFLLQQSSLDADKTSNCWWKRWWFRQNLDSPMRRSHCHDDKGCFGRIHPLSLGCCARIPRANR